MAFFAGEAAAKFVLPQPQAAHDVLDHDDGAVDDDAEVDRAQAHQVSADFALHHAADREEHGERDCQGDDDRGADVAQQQEKHGDNQHCPERQILADGSQRGVDQVAAVIKSGSHHVLGQCFVDLFQLLPDAVRNRAAVLAVEQDGCADHCFAAVRRSGAGAQFFAQCDLGDVLDVYGHAVVRAELDVGDILDALDAAGRADGILLARMFDISAADIGVVGGQGFQHVAKCEVIGDELHRVGGDVILLLITADAVDLRKAGHGAQLRFDDPVLNGAQVHVRVRRAVRLRADGVNAPEVDFAQAGPDRAEERRTYILRQTFLGFGQSFADKLAGAVDVHIVVEDHCYLRDAIKGH